MTTPGTGEACRAVAVARRNVVTSVYGDGNIVSRVSAGDGMEEERKGLLVSAIERAREGMKASYMHSRTRSMICHLTHECMM
jgi:hypothetical protein